MIKVDLLGTSVSICKKSELIRAAEKALIQKKKSYHFLSINPIKIIRAQKDRDLENFIKKADVVYADAIGICIGLKLIHKINQERIPGYEFHFDVLDICNEKELSVYVIGSKQRVIDKAMKLYKIKYPQINFVGNNNGYFNQTYFEKIILKNIQKEKPNLVIVAMGAKLQEHYIETIREKIKVPLLMGLGGTLDAFVGESPRAPKWLLKLGLEWLYRLLRQPHRYKAMLPLPVYAYKVLQKKFFLIK